jgi:beta-barrel assembly-enhancing protease
LADFIYYPFVVLILMLHRVSDLYKQLRHRWVYGLISTLVAFGIVLGTPNPSPAIPLGELIMRGIQVIQLSNVSDAQEVSLGGQINQQLISQNKIKIYSNSSVKQYVNSIGERLVPDSARPDLDYTFQVVEDNALNAFATMGGYVYVTTGLLKAADNEAQLASVIGHEMGHIAAKHALKQMRQAAVTQGALAATGLSRSTAVNIGVELALSRPNGRQDEYEADELGLANLTDAGYAPSAMVAFMEKLLNQRSVPTFLSTHPATSDRITRLEEAIDSATADSGDGLDRAAYRNNVKPL